MQSKSTNWFGIWVCFSAGLVAAMTMNKASPAALDIAADLQLSLFQVGWVVSMVAVATVLLGVASGHVVQRFGALPVLITGVSVLLVTPMLGVFARAPLLLLFDRSLEGLGVILIMVAAPATIIHLAAPRDVGLSMGVWALWMPCGGSLIFLLAPSLLSIGGWRTLWLSTTAAAILILPLLCYLYFYLRRYRINSPALGFLTNTVNTTSETSSSVADTGSSINLRGAILLAVIFACFTADFFGIVTYLPTYLHTVNGLSKANASLLTALLPSALIVGNLLCGALLHRGFRPSVVMVRASILISVSLGVTIWLGEGIPALISLAVFGLFTGIVPTAMFAQAPRFAPVPSAIGMVIGIAVTGQGLGILLAPPLIAYIVGPMQNWNAALPLLLSLPLIVAGSALYLPRFEK